jgi:hypothetical protein
MEYIYEVYDMYHIHVYIFISTKICCGIFSQGMKATESCCYTMTSKRAIMSLSEDLSLGNDYEVSGNTTAIARQQIHNMTTNYIRQETETETNSTTAYSNGICFPCSLTQGYIS